MDESTKLRELGAEIKEFVLGRTEARFPERLGGIERSNAAFEVCETFPGFWYVYLSRYGKKTTYIGRWTGSEEDKARLLGLSEEYRQLYERVKKETMGRVAVATEV